MDESHFDGVWVDCYAEKDELLAFADKHRVQLFSRGSRREILKAIVRAGLDPPRANLEVFAHQATDMRAHRVRYP